MKSFLLFLRGLIAAGSFAGFVGGWALLAHSPKPGAANAPSAAVAPMPWPTLEPPAPLNTGPTQLQPLNLPPLQPQFQPLFRTGGS